MKKTYRLELEVTLDEDNESKAIQIARDYYRMTGGAGEPVGKRGQRLRPIPAEEFVSDVSEALMELADANDLFKKAGIEIVGVSCSEAVGEESTVKGQTGALTDHPTSPSVEEGAVANVDLDEFETGMYLCRWPNGEFSLVMAATKRDALVELDECELSVGVRSWPNSRWGGLTSGFLPTTVGSERACG